MEALEFLKAAKRRYKSNPDENFSAIYFDEPDFEGYVKDVEEWAKNNPIKTRQNVFLEQYPDAIIGDDGFPYVAPCQLCDGLIHGESIEDCENRGLCVECRRDFWMQEVE